MNKENKEKENDVWVSLAVLCCAVPRVQSIFLSMSSRPPYGWSASLHVQKQHTTRHGTQQDSRREEQMNERMGTHIETQIDNESESE